MRHCHLLALDSRSASFSLNAYFHFGLQRKMSRERLARSVFPAFLRPLVANTGGMDPQSSPPFCRLPFMYAWSFSPLSGSPPPCVHKSHRFACLQKESRESAILDSSYSRLFFFSSLFILSTVDQSLSADLFVSPDLSHWLFFPFELVRRLSLPIFSPPFVNFGLTPHPVPYLQFDATFLLRSVKSVC